MSLQEPRELGSDEERAERLCRTHLGFEGTTTRLRGGKHTVTRVTAPTHDVVVKVHSPDNGHVANAEAVMYRILSGSGYATNLLVEGESFIITEFVAGELLLQHYTDERLDDEDLDRVAAFFRDYVVHCAALDPARLASALGGQQRWDAQLEGLILTMAGHLDQLPASAELDRVRGYEWFLRGYVDSHRDRLAAVEPAIVPVDLNFTNFVVTDESQIMCVDLDAVLVGDPLLALGELLAHIHGSDLAARMLHLEPFRDWVTSDDVTFYAVLASFPMLVYALQQGIGLDAMRPWENTQTVVNLIESHLASLAASNRPDHCPTAVANPHPS